MHGKWHEPETSLRINHINHATKANRLLSSFLFPSLSLICGAFVSMPISNTKWRSQELIVRARCISDKHKMHWRKALFSPAYNCKCASACVFVLFCSFFVLCAHSRYVDSHCVCTLPINKWKLHLLTYIFVKCWRGALTSVARTKQKTVSMKTRKRAKEKRHEQKGKTQCRKVNDNNIDLPQFSTQPMLHQWTTRTLLVNRI